jgi:hypothetical protein
MDELAETKENLSIKRLRKHRFFTGNSCSSTKSPGLKLIGSKEQSMPLKFADGKNIS